MVLANIGEFTTITELDHLCECIGPEAVEFISFYKPHILQWIRSGATSLISLIPPFRYGLTHEDYEKEYNKWYADLRAPKWYRAAQNAPFVMNQAAVLSRLAIAYASSEPNICANIIQALFKRAEAGDKFAIEKVWPLICSVQAATTQETDKNILEL